MSNLREAAQQALEALKCLVETHEMGNTIRADIVDAEEAITSLRAALKQPEQEPVAFDALVAISLLTHLGGEVADYEDVVEAVRRLHAVNQELLEALQRSRAQWIHSVNAEFCLAAIARAEGQA